MGYRVYVKEKKTKAHQPGWWDEKKRIEVVTTYLTCGDMKLTSGMTGVPYETIHTWKKQPWWKKYTEELSSENNLQLDAKLTKVMDKALDQVMDRLENGEFMYDPRTGQVKRVPAKLRDAGKVLNDVIDKKQLIKKQEQIINNQKRQEVTVDHLAQLAKAFSEFASGKKQEEKIISVIDGDELLTQKLLENANGLQDKEIKNASETEINHGT